MSDEHAPSESEATDADEAQLWKAWRSGGDAAARGALVERYLPLVRTIARSVYRTTNPNYVDVRDLTQLGNVGLLEAVGRFDDRRGVGFHQYASVRIRGAILSGLPDLSEMHAQQAFRKRTRKERLDSLRTVEPAEARSDVFAAMVELTLGLAIGYMLEGTHLYSDEETPGFQYSDSTEVIAAADSFKGLVQQLPQTQRAIVEYHYQGGLAFNEIAELTGVTKARVSQLHRAALVALRKAHKTRSGIDLRA